MKPSNIKKLIFINNYIVSPVYIILMFWLFFFNGEPFSIEEIIAHRCDLKMYLAFLWAIISLILLRWEMKYPKKIP